MYALLFNYDFFFKLHFLIFILKVSRRVLISGGSGTRKSSMDWTIARFRVSKHEFRIGQIIRTRPNLVPSIHFHGLISGRWPKIWFLSYSIWWHFVIVLRCFKTQADVFEYTMDFRTYIRRQRNWNSKLPSFRSNKQIVVLGMYGICTTTYVLYVPSFKLRRM